MELLRSAPQTPPLLLEIDEDEKMNPLEKLGETFDKLEVSIAPESSQRLSCGYLVRALRKASLPSPQF